MERKRTFRTEYKPDVNRQLDRIQFAVTLHEFGIEADIDDWDGLTDKEVRVLVMRHNIERSQIILMIADDCEKEVEKNEV
jgi:hypothetical protein